MGAGVCYAGEEAIRKVRQKLPVMSEEAERGGLDCQDRAEDIKPTHPTPVILDANARPAPPPRDTFDTQVRPPFLSLFTASSIFFNHGKIP